MALPEKKNVTALILAAGSGERLGGVSKAFLEHNGKPLIKHIVDLVAPYCANIVIALREQEHAQAADIIKNDAVTLIEGGASRHASVACLLAHCKTDFVLLHEVARPFVSATLIESVLDAAGEHGAAVVHLPFRNRDSIGEEEGGMLARTLGKDTMIEIQTPHAYRTKIFKEAYVRAEKEGWSHNVTDSEIVRRAGNAVKLVAGEAANIKLTHPDDLKLLRR